MQLVLHTPGLTLKVKAGSFSITAGEEHRLVSPKQLNSIAVTAGCLISSAAIELAVEHDLPIYFFDEIGDATACLRSPYFESIASLRRKQVYFDDSAEAIDWVLEIMRVKTTGQLSVLAYLRNRKRAQAQGVNEAIFFLEQNLGAIPLPESNALDDLSARLMAWEGLQSKRYWATVSAALPPSWQFDRRSRRPATDGFNAALNYLYGMLYTVVEQAIFAAGLDPHLGILHVDQYDAPTLAFDLIEPFRPLVDRLLIKQFMGHHASPSLFDQRGPGWYLNSSGKRLFIPLFNEWLETRSRFNGRERTNRLHIYQAAADLAREIAKLDI